MKWLRFRLEVAPAGGDFEIRISSPRGEGRSHLELPCPPEDLAALALAEPSKVGATLAKALFQGKTLSLYERCFDLLEDDGQAAMRLELIFELRGAKSLQALPWELLEDPLSRLPLALNPRTSLARYLRVPFPVRAAIRPPKLRILAVAADPRLPGFPQLDLTGELRALEDAFAEAPEVEIVPMAAAQSLAVLREALVSSACHVLHFMGHGGRPAGSPEQVLFFEGERRSSDPVHGADLLTKLAGLPSLRLVVLNACESGRITDDGEIPSVRPLDGIATTLVAGRLPAVIAMQKKISDSAAIAWSGAFYRRLAAGATIDAAMAEARQAIHSANRSGFEWATPVLYSRTETGEIFPPADLPPERAPRNRNLLAKVGAGALLLLALSGALGVRLRDEARARRFALTMAQGTEEIQKESWSAARDRFEEARKLAPRSAEAAANLAFAAERLGDLRGAEDLYRESQRLAPDSAESNFKLGHFLNDQEDFDGAYPLLLSAVHLDPNRSEAWAELARSAGEQRLFDRARRMIGVALRLEPERAVYHRRLGEIELSAGRPEAALPAFETARNLYPQGEPGAVLTLALTAQTYDRLGEGDSACRFVAAFRRFDTAGITSSAPKVDALADRRRCPKTENLP